jgi:hypothetical protein
VVEIVVIAHPTDRQLELFLTFFSGRNNDLAPARQMTRTSFFPVVITIAHPPDRRLELFFRSYSGVYLKRCSHSSVNSYVVGMEHETIVLHPELSLQIRSRARHMVNSWKKEQDDGLQANCYYELISCVLVNLKHAN